VSFIETIPVEAAVGNTAAIYADELAHAGFIPNYARAFSHRPALYAAWGELNKTVKSTMDPRRYELATMGAAIAIGSSYCSLAHGKKLLGLGSDEEEVRSLVRGTPDLGEQERAIVAFAAKVAETATAVTQTDIDELRALGLDDSEIFDVGAAAAARCFFSKLIDSIGTLPDAAYREMIPGLADDLTVGRPIAEPT
jgi:uncharacterized peroxidase-related enzyme